MPDSESLIDFFQRHPKVWVLTGAGISLASGIPTYRDQHGNWQRNDPIKHWEFINQLSKRKRYWARSMVGWREMRAVSPNVVHQALTALQSAGAISQIVTQNVDGLHQSAGSRNVIDLHGRMDSVCCMDCGALSEREALQTRLETLNPELAGFVADVLPDGDADIDDYPIETVLVPECEACGGMLKPDVVFFGDNVPRDRVAVATNGLTKSDALLVVGSSLQVLSGFRFCRLAAEQSIPMACINPGKTRADDLFDWKWQRECGPLLQEAAQQIEPSTALTMAGRPCGEPMNP